MFPTLLALLASPSQAPITVCASGCTETDAMAAIANASPDDS